MESAPGSGRRLRGMESEPGSEPGWPAPGSAEGSGVELGVVSALESGPKLTGLGSGLGLGPGSEPGLELGWPAPGSAEGSGVELGVVSGSAPRRLAQRSDGVSGLESAPEW